MKKLLFLPILFVLVFAFHWIDLAGESKKALPDLGLLKTGDVIFQSSKSRQCEAVKKATKSKFSHVGMIIKNAKGTFVLEAVEPVSLTPINEWIKRGENNYYEVKTPIEELKITASNQKILDSLSKIYLTKHYDLHFNWSDERLYCSELVWKVYKHVFGIELSELKKMKDFNLEDPIVKVILEERYGKNIPLNETVVAPEDLYQSPKLKRL